MFADTFRKFYKIILAASKNCTNKILSAKSRAKIMLYMMFAGRTVALSLMWVVSEYV